MKDTKSVFILKFALPCRSPGRDVVDSEYVYDHLEDLVRWTGRKDKPFAIEAAGLGGPKTKKSDIEKGDDNKDRRMWQQKRDVVNDPNSLK